MSHTFEILTELPYSGKTGVLISVYLEQLNRQQQTMDFGSALWLTPTFRSRRETLRQLMQSNTGVIFAPNVYTFDQFADAVLDTQQESGTFLNPTQKRILVRTIIHDLHQENQLKHFERIHQTGGFLDLVVEFLSEIKRDEIWPDDLEGSFQQRRVGPKERELHLIYKVYQDRLRQLDSFDAEGRFWLARTLIQEGQLAPFDELKLVVVDGFSDFTRTQHEILDLLAQRTERVVISLPYEAGQSRQMLFAKSGRTMTRFERHAKLQHHTTGSLRGSVDPKFQAHAPKVDSEVPVAMRTIASNLFSTQSQAPLESNANGLEIIALSGLQSEYEILAERVKRLLVEGVPAEDIAVVFRSLNDVSVPLRHAWSAAGIPFSCETRDALNDWAVVKFFRLVLKLEIEDWSYTSLTRLLRSNHFRPPWPLLNEGCSAVLAHMRSRNILGGREAILASLQRRFENLASKDDADAAELKASQAALQLAQQLDELTEPLRNSSTFHAWLERLRTVLEVCNPRESTETIEPETNLNTRTIESLFEILFNAAQFFEDAHQAASHASLTLAEFSEQVHDLISSHATVVNHDERGRVRVLSASHVRNLDVQYLFVAGMNEGSFPTSRTDSCLFNEADRQWLNDSGVTLPTAEVHLQDEMLLFYNVVTRARKLLTLSYCSTSSKGQPLFPSPFVTAVKNLFSLDAIKITHVERWTPIPDDDSVMTSGQLRTLAVSQTFRKQPQRLKWLLNHESTSKVAINLLAAAKANAHRFEQTGMTIYEGMLSANAAVHLKKHFDAQYQFSATQLENFASCPFRFLLKNILQIEPLDAPETATNYMNRGLVVHEAFSKLYSDSTEAELLDRGLSEKLTELLLEVNQRFHATTRLEKTLHELEAELMVQWAGLYEEQWNTYLDKTDGFDEQFRPAFVEVPFGDVRLESNEANRKQHPPLKMGAEETPVYIQGRIDRVDAGRLNETTVYNVVDYKTGSPKTFKQSDIERGLALQLALYTVAVTRLKLLGEDSVPYQMGYWAVKEKGFFAGVSRSGGTKQLKALGEELVADITVILDELLPRLTERIRGGVFPVVNPNDDCTGRCAFHTVCRVNQIRSLSEHLGKDFNVSAAESKDSEPAGAEQK